MELLFDCGSLFLLAVSSKVLSAFSGAGVAMLKPATAPGTGRVCMRCCDVCWKFSFFYQEVADMAGRLAAGVPVVDIIADELPALLVHFVERLRQAYPAKPAASAVHREAGRCRTAVTNL